MRGSISKRVGPGWMMLLAAILLVGCGGSSVSPGSNGSGGAGGSNATDTAGSGDSLDLRADLASNDGAADLATTEDTGGSGGAGGAPPSGTGGAKADASGTDTGSGGATVADSGGGTDLPRPPTCQAGEDCTGTYTCTASRCLRNEEEVCHCLNNQLFCGPVACTRDAGVSDATPASDAALAICPDQTSTGDTCNAAQDRACVFPCVNGRRRECFCSQITDEWICTGAMRC